VIEPGRVNEELEATIPNEVVFAGRRRRLIAVIDTGFNGHLTLGAADVAFLQLPFHSLAITEMGDATAVTLRKFEAAVEWNEQVRRITVLEAEGGPLVGMAMLRDHHLAMDVVPGGTVEVTDLSNRSSSGRA